MKIFYSQYTLFTVLTVLINTYQPRVPVIDKNLRDFLSLRSIYTLSIWYSRVYDSKSLLELIFIIIIFCCLSFVHFIKYLMFNCELREKSLWDFLRLIFFFTLCIILLILLKNQLLCPVTIIYSIDWNSLLNR